MFIVPSAKPRFFALAALVVLSNGLPLERADAQQNLIKRIYDPPDGTVRIEVDSVFAGAAARGFMPVRVTLRNIRKEDRNWDLRFSFNRSGGWNQMAFDSSFRVSAPAGTEPVHELMVPVPTSINSGSTYRSLNVEATSSGLPTASNNDSTNYSTGWPTIGLSQKLADRNANRLNTAVQARSGSGRSENFGQQFNPEHLPSDWRGYTSLDTLMMTDEEWRKVPPGARLAVIEWVRLGGKLDIYTTGDSIAALESLDLAGSTAATGSKRPLSLGEVRVWKWNGQDLEANAMVNRYRNVENRADQLGQDYKTGWNLYQAFGEKSFNPWLVILLLIAFGIIVGPVNLFVWAKPGRRHRLFVTTPIISLVASGLILILILFNDGIGGKGKRFVLANLQPEAQEKRLYVTQEQICRTGVLLGSGFSVEDPIFISPVMIPASEWNRFNLSGNVVAAFSLSNRTYRGDWFQSRSEQGHFVQAVRPTRSRIELIGPASDAETPPKLFSSLEFSVDEFFYRDNLGRVWKAKNGTVAGGEEIALTAAEPEDLRKWWKNHIDDMSDKMGGRAGKLWERPGHFFATSTDRNAGFVKTLRSINWKEDKALVFGSVPAASGNQPSPEASEKSPQ